MRQCEVEFSRQLPELSNPEPFVVYSMGRATTMYRTKQISLGLTVFPLIAQCMIPSSADALDGGALRLNTFNGWKAFEVISEYGDAGHPQMFPMASATKLSEGVTRDARCHQAFIDGAATPRLQGQCGTAPLIEIGVYTGRMGFHESSELQG